MIHALVIHALVGTLLAAGIPAAPAVAQNEGMGVLGPGVAREDLIRALKPRGPTRGIGTRKIEIEPGKQASEQDLSKVNLTIEFKHGSDQLTPAGQKQLDALGAALQDPSLKSFRFMIAGHTDGAGSEAYNQQLSERRAAAVKAYLVGQSGIEEARLATVGFGKSKPLNAANPMSAENRRVEIFTLSN